MKPYRAVVATVLVLATAVASAWAGEPVNKTTSTAESASKLIKEGDDSFVFECEGEGGYGVIHRGEHGRSWIELVYDSEQTDLMNPILNAAGGNWGTKADDELIWRGVMQEGQFVPYACIFKMVAQNEESQSSVETYVVLQLSGAGSTVAGSVPAAKGMAAAEALADGLPKP